MMELFWTEICQPDRDLLEAADGLGRQIGQFLDRKRTQDALAQRQRELAELIEHSGLGLHWIGPEGRILRVNQAGLDLLGYAAEEYVGRDVRDIHADREGAEQLLRRLSMGQTVRDYPARLRCKDGSLKRVLINASARWQGGRLLDAELQVSPFGDAGPPARLAVARQRVEPELGRGRVERGMYAEEDLGGR